MPEVFISYSRKDTAFALKLTADLERQGIHVWIDQGDIVAGDAWRKQIVEGIQGCRVFLIVLSPNSAKSENVIKELSLAETNRKKIIPILYQPVDIPEDMEYQLSGLQYQAFDRGNYEDNVARLAEVINGIPAKRQTSAAPSTPTRARTSSMPILIGLGIGCVVVLLFAVGLTATLVGPLIGHGAQTPTVQTAQGSSTTGVPTSPATTPPSPATTIAPPTIIIPPPATTVAPTTPAPVLVRACTKLPNMPVVSAGQVGSPDKPIVIVYIPSGDTAAINKAGAAIADCLGKATGLVYKTQVGTSFAASADALGAGNAQVGFLDLFTYLSAHDKYGVSAGLVWDRTYRNRLENFYQSQFIASGKSGINKIADLKGWSFCFTDPGSLSGYIIPQAMMKANGVDPNKDLKSYQFAGSHLNVATAVYKGSCTAGATFVDVLTDPSFNLAKTIPDILDMVRVFAYTDKIPNDGVQFNKNFDSRLRSATIDALMVMANDSDGKAILRQLYNSDCLEKQGDTFYDDFRALMKKAGVNVDQYVK